MFKEKIIFFGHGKHKTANARVMLINEKIDSKPKIIINNQLADSFWWWKKWEKKILEPLLIVDQLNKLKIKAIIEGSSYSSQWKAFRLGIAKAILKMDTENQLQYKQLLKQKKLLTRDSRKKWKKVFGKKGARKSPQFSKR
jgi:small subunit ribosomal protein S9